jgi:small conductance mechanosensitive channel
MNLDLAQFMTRLQELGTTFGLRILAGLAILIIGRLVAKGIAGLVRRAADRHDIDKTLSKFMYNLTYMMLLTFVIVAALGQVGIQTTSFVAILGAAGLAIGLALQGALANFAAGVMMIIFRPVKIDDYIEAGGSEGFVEDVGIFVTTLRTHSNKTVIVPNAKVTGDNVINYSTKGTLRVDLVFGISYEDDIDKAKKILLDVCAADPNVLADPAPFVGVVEHADSSVNLVCRPWAKQELYWDAYFGVTEGAKKAFDNAGITIPFPQRDVHLSQQSA